MSVAKTIKALVKPRKRTNRAPDTARLGKAIISPTGDSVGKLHNPAVDDNGGLIIYPTQEVEREVTDVSGCLVAVRSRFLYSDGEERWLTWATTSQITEV